MLVVDGLRLHDLLRARHCHIENLYPLVAMPMTVCDYVAVVMTCALPGTPLRVIMFTSSVVKSTSNFPGARIEPCEPRGARRPLHHRADAKSAPSSCCPAAVTLRIGSWQWPVVRAAWSGLVYRGHHARGVDGNRAELTVV